MLKLPPKHQNTKLHPVKYNVTQFNRVNKMLIIKNICFGGILCFSDLVVKNDF